MILRYFGLLISMMAVAVNVFSGVIPLSGYIIIPLYENVVAAAPSTASPLTNWIIDADGEKVGAIFNVRRSGNVRNIIFGINATTTGATFNVRMEQLDSNGLPSGTLWNTNCSGTITLASTDDAVAVVSGNLTADCPVSSGDRIGIFMERTGGSGSATLNNILDNQYDYALGISSIGASGFTKLQQEPRIALKYDDGSYSAPWPYSPDGNVGATLAVGNATNPNFVGNRFVLPFDATVIGASTWIDADGDSVVNLSNGSDVYQATCTFTSAHRQLTNAMSQICYFNTAVNVSSGTAFFIFHRPTTATSITAHYATMKSASGLSYADMDYNIVMSSASNPTSSGDWSVMTNQRVYLRAIINEIRYPDSGGGGTRAYPVAH